MKRGVHLRRVFYLSGVSIKKGSFYLTESSIVWRSLLYGFYYQAGLSINKWFYVGRGLLIELWKWLYIERGFIIIKWGFHSEGGVDRHCSSTRTVV